jgi:hypothetical protein
MKLFVKTFVTVATFEEEHLADGAPIGRGNSCRSKRNIDVSVESVFRPE